MKKIFFILLLASCSKQDVKKCFTCSEQITTEYDTAVTVGYNQFDTCGITRKEADEVESYNAYCVHTLTFNDQQSTYTVKTQRFCK